MPFDAIDVHTHIFAPGWPDFAARYGGDRWPRLESDPATACKLFVGATFNRTLTPQTFDPARRVEDAAAPRASSGPEACRCRPPTSR